LWDDDTYYRLLEAVDDSAAMEGSTVVDDILAAQMLKQLAASEGNSFVASTPLASLVLSLRVVLRRYELSRKERRMKVGDVAVKGNGDTGSVGDVGAE
jgi:hypothetical protein